MDSNTMCILLLIFFCIVCLVCLLINIKKNGLRGTVIKLIVRAEELLGSGYGKEKMDIVVDALTKLLPSPLRLLVTKELLEGIVQSVFDEIKEALDYQKKDVV